MKMFLVIMFGAVFTSVILGELVRLPIFTTNGLLPNDLLLAITVGVWGFDKTFRERRWPKSPLWAPFILFSLLGVLSLALASTGLTLKETLSSGLYWVRFVEYFAWSFVVADLISTPKHEKQMFRIFLGSALALSVLGFLQLQFFPDFDKMQEMGWDPHFYRLLSTWYDPNFIGGMLALLLSILASHFLETKNSAGIVRIGTMGIVLLAALFLTYSRSGYLAFMVSIFVLGVVRSPKILLAGGLAGLLLISTSSRAYERVADMAHSGLSLISNTAELPDATARLRVESWEEAWVIFKTHPILGVGFNTYAYAKKEYGFVKSLEIHSASGSDSTLLTILATTGVIGFSAYLWLLGSMLYVCFKHRKNPTALGTFAGMIGLLAHSIFVNSLLFSPLLIFLYTAVGLSHKTRAPAKLCECPAEVKS